MKKTLITFMLILSSTVVFAEDAPSLSINTNGFLNDGIMPVLYTCDGKDESPQFSISTPPAKAKTFAMVVTDENAPQKPFYHWLLFNVSSTTKEFKQGMITPLPGSLMGKNSFGLNKYNGPCPPKGSAHTYTFTLYALDAPLSLTSDADGLTLEKAMQGHVLGQTKFVGVYSRWLK